MKVALAGQPNCGKSTLFNQIAGYKAISSNFPGTTITFNATQIQINGQTITCLDLPGTYSITSSEPVEVEARRHLLSGDVDIIINVVDASLLGRSLELTLELLELEIPMILCLNMMDEAQRKGIQLDPAKLSDLLGIPVVPTIATIGKGVKELFNELFRVAEKKPQRKIPKFSKDIEETIAILACRLEGDWPIEEKLPSRFLAIRLLENEEIFIDKVKAKGDLFFLIRTLQEKLEKAHGVPSDQVISSERHALAMNLFEKVATVTRLPRKDIGWIIDGWALHWFFGYLILAAVFYGFFNFIFGIGGIIEGGLIGWAGQIIEGLAEKWNPESLAFFLVKGFLQGVSGGVAIVLPYLVPFLIGLALLEDVGYLPRVAFLMDTFMHRIGLHGKSIIPLILGYGCSVPAVMATQILEFPRHRVIVSILTTLIPCSARITIIFGLVAFFISPNAALFIFALNLWVVATLGKILSILYPDVSLGLILEIPSYQIPNWRNTFSKSWCRIREFLVIAWPLLIGGSVVLALLEWGNIDIWINRILFPLTYLLDLPEPVGTTLIFGLLRKELSMIMLTQALGTTEILTVMNKTQIMTFTMFVIFYIPCLATLAALQKEIGRKGTLMAITVNLILAFGISLLTRFIAKIFFS
jgi:ferrous iron transport protein B